MAEYHENEKKKTSVQNGASSDSLKNDSKEKSADGSAAGKPEEAVTEKKKTPKKIIVRNVLIVAFSLIFGLTGSVMVYGYYLLNLVNYNSLDDMVINSSAVVTDENDASLSVESAVSSLPEVETVGSLIKDPMVQNIILFGSDVRPNESGYGRSDTMILLSIDNRRHKLKLTSFLRDTWVHIPGFLDNRLNASYSFGGPKLAIQTIERNFGVDIDRYAVVDFQSFSKIINILGGLDIELTSEEVEYINTKIRTDEKEKIYLENKGDGMYHLNGTQALWHSRNRTVGLVDFSRTQRQREVLDALITQFKGTTDVWTIRELLVEILPMITTNITQNEMMSMAANSLTYLNYEVEEFRLPQDGNYESPTLYRDSVPMSVLTINDMQKARQELAEFIYEDSAKTLTEGE